MSGWDDDDDMFGFDEESTDLGDEPVTVASKPSEPVRAQVRAREHVQTRKTEPGKGRRIKVKPMSATMAKMWPDVMSCLLTLSSGKQVMFVRG